MNKEEAEKFLDAIEKRINSKACSLHFGLTLAFMKGIEIGSVGIMSKIAETIEPSKELEEVKKITRKIRVKLPR